MARPRKNPVPAAPVKASPQEVSETPVPATETPKNGVFADGAGKLTETHGKRENSPFASESERAAWVAREANFISRFVADPKEAKRLAEEHAKNAAQYNLLRGW